MRTRTGTIPVCVLHPAEMAEPEINAFLNHLAVKEMVSVNATSLIL
jgi:hypothetical protein